MQEVLYIIIAVTLVLFFLLILYTASKINSLTGKIAKIMELLEKFKKISPEPEKSGPPEKRSQPTQSKP
jgi:cell division protein FtsL